MAKVVHWLHKYLHMASSTSRRLQDRLLALFGLSAVVSGMAAIDGTARQHVFNALRGDFPAVPPAFQFHTLMKHVSDLLPMGGDTSFVAFGVMGFVLVVVMFRM
jgi:hypothetical protein